MRFATLDGRKIEYRMIPGDAGLPPLVFLHEGLGSARLWRDFPDRVARRLGARALVYSRFGYGRSDPLLAPRTPRFMHEEALDVLSRLLEELGLRRPFLVGHSDGASIALIHAASGAPVAGLALLAPHVMVEEITVRSIARVTELYWSGDLRDRMARHHANVDDAFLGWSDIWLAPEFCTWSLAEEVGRLRAPALLIQGEDDEYGTLAQLDLIERLAPVRPARLVLARAGHSPHRDQPAATNDAICGFARGFLSS